MWGIVRGQEEYILSLAKHAMVSMVLFSPSISRQESPRMRLSIVVGTLDLHAYATSQHYHSRIIAPLFLERA